MKKLFILLIFHYSLTISAQVPSFNSPVRLDVATWNIEWFGDASNGPSNENTQLTNAVQLIKGMDIDFMSLCEISDSTYWKKLLNALPEYSGVISTWAQTQKTALIFKKNQFTCLYSKHILSQYEADFASGRLPLEVCLQRNIGGRLDTFFVWVIHLKANIGTTSQKSESYNKRYNASVYLKNYINQYFRNRKGLVMGDWNDDFDKSIFNNNTSPFVNWRDDVSYLVPTYQLSLKGQRTTASYTDAIDHITATPALKPFWVKDSVQAFYANAYIGSFSSNTSDHFPVFTRFYDVINQSSNVDVLEMERFFFNGEFWEGSPIVLDQQIMVFSFLGKQIYRGKLREFIPKKGEFFLISSPQGSKFLKGHWTVY